MLYIVVSCCTPWFQVGTILAYFQTRRKLACRHSRLYHQTPINLSNHHKHGSRSYTVWTIAQSSFPCRGKRRSQSVLLLVPLRLNGLNRSIPTPALSPSFSSLYIYGAKLVPGNKRSSSTSTTSRRSSRQTRSTKDDRSRRPLHSMRPCGLAVSAVLLLFSAAVLLPAARAQEETGELPTPPVQSPSISWRASLN